MLRFISFLTMYRAVFKDTTRRPGRISVCTCHINNQYLGDEKIIIITMKVRETKETYSKKNKNKKNDYDEKAKKIQNNR